MCLIIVVINFFYMRSYVYKEGDLYRFNPDTIVETIEQGLIKTPGGEWRLEEVVKGELALKGLAVQVLDLGLVEQFSFGSPSIMAPTYSAASLVALAQSEQATVFVKALEQFKGYTLVVFFSTEQVKRTTYTYQVALVESAYNIYWLVGMNVALLIMFSYMYTYSISRPIERLIEGIMRLSRGDYQTSGVTSGVYATVEGAIQGLAEHLSDAMARQTAANIARETWISNLSHDIKTPLTSIMGYGEIIGDLEYPLTNHERAQYAKIINEKGTYIESLVSELNLTIRLKQDRDLLKKHPADLIQVLRLQLIDVMNSPIVGEANHTLAYTYDIDSAIVMLDSVYFNRVIVNLVHNAFTHNPHSVHVQVHVSVDAVDRDWVSITVEDNGRGVPKQELEQIFSRYYRGTHTHARSEGSGLGLAIAKDIVEAHGGSIESATSAQGGLKLTIKLKVVPPSRVAP